MKNIGGSNRCFNSSVSRLVLLLGGAAMLLVIASATAASSSSDGSGRASMPQFRKLQQFLAEPPVIRALHFEVRENISYSAPEMVRFDTNRYFAKYQREKGVNCFFLRSVFDLEDVSAPSEGAWLKGAMAGSTATDSWSLRSDGILMVIGGEPFDVAAEDPVALAGGTRTYYWLKTMLNLGLTEIPIHSITWDGLSFVVTRQRNAFRGEMILKGEMIVTNNVAIGVKVDHHVESGIFTYSTEFDYGEAPLLGFLPQRIIRRFHKGGKATLDCEMSILKIETGGELMPESAFALPEGVKPVSRITLSGSKTSQPDETLIPRPATAPPALASPSAPRRFDGFFFGVMIFTALAAFGWGKMSGAKRERAMKKSI